MRTSLKILFLVLVFLISACETLLEPQPVDKLTDDLVLNEPADVEQVEVGLYSAFRNITPAVIIAGDFTADMLIHNGTFTQYREFGIKQITASNATAASLWGAIYNTVYIANFILERLPEIGGVPSAQRNKVMGTAYFLRGYAYFTALYSFGGVPEVLTTDIDANRNISRASEEDILALVLQDYNEALGLLPEEPVNTGYAGTFTVRAALARLHLYLENWDEAEDFATEVIDSELYELEEDYSALVNEDFTDEAIFEMGYTLADDPGTSALGLNNLFVGRREIIPSNQVIVSLVSSESGDRFSSILFNASDLNGTDNGWSVAKYGTADADNNNIVVFRLAEMYLTRAEARAQQNNVTGSNSAQSDINLLRVRSNAPTITTATKSQMIQLIEQERVYELAFEGHRWYDLVRTGRAAAVMTTYSSNWKETYEKWPIPLREIQNNPALVGNQNPGY